MAEKMKIMVVTFAEDQQMKMETVCSSKTLIHT